MTGIGSPLRAAGMFTHPKGVAVAVLCVRCLLEERQAAPGHSGIAFVQPMRSDREQAIFERWGSDARWMPL